MAQQIVAHGFMKYILVDWSAARPASEIRGPDRSVDPPRPGCARWSPRQGSQSDMAAVKPAFLTPRRGEVRERGVSTRGEVLTA